MLEQGAQTPGEGLGHGAGSSLEAMLLLKGVSPSNDANFCQVDPHHCL